MNQLFLSCQKQSGFVTTEISTSDVSKRLTTGPQTTTIAAMHQQNMAILQSLISVAWADGKVADEEIEVIEALLQAFDASAAEADFIRNYSKSMRTLDDIPVDDLLGDDRRVLLQHAVLLTFIDGKQDESEKTFLNALAAKLQIDDKERDELLHAASERAKRFLNLLEALSKRVSLYP